MMTCMSESGDNLDVAKHYNTTPWVPQMQGLFSDAHSSPLGTDPKQPQ